MAEGKRAFVRKVEGYESLPAMKLTQSTLDEFSERIKAWSQERGLPEGSRERGTIVPTGMGTSTVEVDENGHVVSRDREGDGVVDDVVEDG